MWTPLVLSSKREALTDGAQGQHASWREEATGLLHDLKDKSHWWCKHTAAASHLAGLLGSGPDDDALPPANQAEIIREYGGVLNMRGGISYCPGGTTWLPLPCQFHPV